MKIPKNVKFSNPFTYNRLNNPQFVGQVKVDDEPIQVVEAGGQRHYFKDNIY